MSIVTVQLFASYAEVLGAPQIEIVLPPRARVADVVAAVRSLPGAQSLPPNPRVAVNQRFAEPDVAVSAADEIALIPPVAGG
ncbi:MAG TPA: MoaD/ThiS family protein [Gemmatimonadaceae bacterium]